MDLIINENEEQARELFHDIVVDASREIYESIMEEEMMMDDDDEMVGEAGDLLDEISAISAEEEGMMEDEEDDLAMDDYMADADDSFELDADDMEDDGEGEEVEDAVIRIEDKVDDTLDKLDQLMRDFEEIMGGGDDMADDDMDAEEDSEEEEIMEISSNTLYSAADKARDRANKFGDTTGLGDMEKIFRDKEEKFRTAAGKRTRDENRRNADLSPAQRRKLELEEAVQLQKVSVTHGDNGVQTKSTVAANSGQRGMASRPVAASTAVENGRAAPTTKDVKGAGSFKNAPGQKKQDLTSAPKPVTKDGSANDRSPVAK